MRGVHCQVEFKCVEFKLACLRSAAGDSSERGSRDGGSRAPRPPRPASGTCGELSHRPTGATPRVCYLDPPPDGAWLAHVRAPTRELVAGERECDADAADCCSAAAGPLASGAGRHRDVRC